LFDELVKSHSYVIPDLIRNPEVIEKPDSGLRRNDGKSTFGTFYEFVLFNEGDFFIPL